MNISHVGEGTVVLISGGGKVYTDIAARFVGSERSLDEIVASEYNRKIIQNILTSGHLAATEFDYFIFGVEGYSRVCETQLVRKRLANYLIKSGRVEKKGKRSFDFVFPKSILDLEYYSPKFHNTYNGYNILELIEEWYSEGIKQDFKEEELRYLKPQATEFKGIIGMNCHALLDWFKIRCCQNAQIEIRDMANKMLKLCKEASPDLFEKAGASCISLGYCPENNRQNEKCINKISTHNDILSMIADERAEKLYHSMLD